MRSALAFDLDDDPFALDGFDGVDGDVEEPVGEVPAGPALFGVPDHVEPGDPVGVPVMFAGADLYDSSATIISYPSPDNPDVHRLVLYARVTPEGERHLAEAIAGGPDGLVERQVDTVVAHTHPADEETGLGWKISSLASMVNVALSSDRWPGRDPEQYLGDYDAAVESLARARVLGAPDDMLWHYQEQLEMIAERLHPDFDAPYHAGGKLPSMRTWEWKHTVSTTVVEPDFSAPGALVGQVGKAARLDIEMDTETGRVRWDGNPEWFESRNDEWQVDLGDGFRAHYQPTALTGGESDWSSLRRLTVVSPRGATPADVVERLGRLGIDTRPASPADAEYTYLERCAYAAGVHDHPKVAAVRVDVTGARRREIPAEVKATRMRDAVAEATGRPSGEALAASPGYDPTPKRSGGQVVWSRFDVDDTALGAWDGQAVVHHLRAEGMATVLRSGGVLAAQEVRHRMGVGRRGSSVRDDRVSGGASSLFFFRQDHTGPPGHGSGVVYEGEQLRALLRRSDARSTPVDNYGATNPSFPAFTHRASRDVATMATHGEVTWEGGVDLFREPPTWIFAPSERQRDKVIATLHEVGVRRFADGRAVEDVVVVSE